MSRDELLCSLYAYFHGMDMDGYHLHHYNEAADLMSPLLFCFWITIWQKIYISHIRVFGYLCIISEV